MNAPELAARRQINDHKTPTGNNTTVTTTTLTRTSSNKDLSCTAIFLPLKPAFLSWAFFGCLAMAARLDLQTLGLVFQSRPDILAGIQKAAGMRRSLTFLSVVVM